MSDVNDWVEWEGRLSDRELPVSVALSVLRNGSALERQELAINSALPADIALVLATDDDQDVLEILSSNYAVPTEVLEKLVLSGRVDAERIAGNPNAPIHRKLAAPLHLHPPSSLRRFFDTVRASDEERDAVHAARDSRAHRDDTLGAVWARVRPGTVTG
jgi:hypothetical protein